MFFLTFWKRLSFSCLPSSPFYIILLIFINARVMTTVMIIRERKTIWVSCFHSLDSWGLGQNILNNKNYTDKTNILFRKISSSKTLLYLLFMLYCYYVWILFIKIKMGGRGLERQAVSPFIVRTEQWIFLNFLHES